MSLTLTPDYYILYRKARFGDAGRHGAVGVAAAARHHGVTTRSWWYYEAGRMHPKPAHQEAIRAWLRGDTADDTFLHPALP